MGVGFAAILSHPFDNADILSLPERLNADQEGLGKAASAFHDFVKQGGELPLLKDDTSWHWQAGLREWDATDPEAVWDVNKVINLAGPGSIGVYFGRTTCHLFIPFRWSHTITDPIVQLETRKICHAVVNAFFGNHGIYLPESGPWQVTAALDLLHEGATLSETEDWLRQHIGETASNLAEVDELMNRGNRGRYYIDHFEDF